MATLPSTVKEFNVDAGKFIAIMGIKTYTQEQVSAAYKCLSLRYLGLYGASDEELENCATILKIVTNGAIARGWQLT